MTQEIRKFLNDIVASCLGLSEDRVIWRNQGAPKQANPIVVLFVYSVDGQAMPDFMPIDKDGVSEMHVPTDAVLEVQMFDKKGQFPVDKLERLVRMLETPDIVEQCAANGIAFFDSEPVQDVTALLPNSQQYEPRAAVDLRFRYTSVTAANVGIIDTVEVDGTVGGRELAFSVSAESNE